MVGDIGASPEWLGRRRSTSSARLAASESCLARHAGSGRAVSLTVWQSACGSLRVSVCNVSLARRAPAAKR